MLKCLSFGKPKQSITPLQTLDQLSEKLEDLEKREAALKKRVSTEVDRVRQHVTARNKRAALVCLKKKQMYEKEIENLGNYQLRIHDQMILLEGATATTETVAALRTGADTLKRINKDMTINNVDKMMDEINEQTENMKQIQETLSAPIGGADFDEDELEAELEELESAELEKQLLQPATTAASAAVNVVPSERQQKTGVRPTPHVKPAEMDELTALQAEMAL
ncbi:hypothetical protein AQUCO_02000373v1 [Aquilegia coerulea]|uniref:Uncharacterized protein n=1 Tax=Aquilegia coerulea TaxID=218851 RepID=A0A2G5DH99_AQUCA|nr:hypothetical protein AQUCO_02000373v1 [Aquilegia coerulea]